MQKSLKLLVVVVGSLTALAILTVLMLLQQRAPNEDLGGRGISPAAGGAAPLSAKRSVSIILAEVNQENGLQQVFNMGDGLTQPASIDGVPCRELGHPGGTMGFAYFMVAPSFKSATPVHAWVEVEYFDAASDAMLFVQYDGMLKYTASEWVRSLKKTSQWSAATFELTDALLSGRENGGADFRIVATKPTVFIRRVTLKAK